MSDDLPACSTVGSEIDFVLMGPSGFLGAAILRSLESSNYSVHATRIRLKDRLGLEALLDKAKPKLGVICAAGERGRPNITWCDSHPVETVDANITGQLSVAAACYERGLHVILVGTGALYVSSERNGNSPKVTHQMVAHPACTLLLGRRWKSWRISLTMRRWSECSTLSVPIWMREASWENWHLGGETVQFLFMFSSGFSQSFPCWTWSN